MRAVGCLGKQFELFHHFTGRRRLPSRRVTALPRYYSAIRLLSSLHRFVLFVLHDYRSCPCTAEAERPLRVRYTELRCKTVAYTRPRQRILGLTAASQLTPGVHASAGASLSFDSTSHLRLPPDTPSRVTPRTGGAGPSALGWRPCLVGVRFPPSGSSEDLVLLYFANFTSCSMSMSDALVLAYGEHSLRFGGHRRSDPPLASGRMLDYVTESCRPADSVMCPEHSVTPPTPTPLFDSCRDRYW